MDIVRFFVVMLQLCGILFIHLPFTGNVSMTADVPGQINAGSDIKIQITLSKSDINSFARFQMELPPGITAVNGYSANADFSFRDQKIRLIWLKIPDNDVITFSFNIHCNDHLKGTFDVSGKFSYIQDNEKKMVDFEPQHINIIPSTTIDPNLIVDIADYGKSIYSQTPVTIADVACIRQKPEWSETNHQFVITLLLNKEKLKKFAKIEETIPPGFTALNVESKEGIFTFKDNKAKFLWMNLPSEPYFTVKYKLIPMNETNAKQVALKGTFSYIIEDKTQSIPIIEKDISLDNLTADMVKSILSAPAVPGATVASANTETAGNKTNEIIKPAIATVQNTKEVGKKEADTSGKVKNTNVKEKAPVTATVKTPTTEKSSQLEPINGIYFRVQLAAGHRPVNVKRYFHKFKLDTTIFRENHEGWIKYSVGTFNKYKDARDYRVHIWNTTTIADAFVAAYNEGKRITVQEALMVTSQHWYK